MTTNTGSLDLDDLLKRSSDLHRLARALLYDASHADDVVQQAWLLALQSTPARLRSPAGWLRGVVRHLSLRKVREETGRTRREQAAARPERVDSTVDAVVRLEVLTRLVAALRALDEPYREVITRRFLDELSPGEIAAERDVPEPTVRTQFRRGLEQLRRRLDGEYRDSRALLLCVLAPLAGPAPEAAAAASAALATLKVLIAVAALLAVGFYLGVVYDRPEESRAPSAVAGGPEVEAPDALSPSAPGPSDSAATDRDAADREAVREEVGPAAALPPEVAELVGSWITGMVVDTAGHPAPGAIVIALRPAPEAEQPPLWEVQRRGVPSPPDGAEGFAQEDGRFGLFGLSGGAEYDLYVVEEEYGQIGTIDRDRRAVARVTTPARDVRLALDGAFLDITFEVPPGLESEVDDQRRFRGDFHLYSGRAGEGCSYGGGFPCSFRARIRPGEPVTIVVWGKRIHTVVLPGIVVTAAQGVRSLSIPLTPRDYANELILEVVDEEGRAVAEAILKLGVILADTPPGMDGRTVLDKGGDAVVDGMFRATNLEPGPTKITVHSVSDRRLVPALVDVVMPVEGALRQRIVLQVGGSLVVEVDPGSRELNVSDLRSTLASPADRSEHSFEQVGTWKFLFPDELLLKPGGRYRHVGLLAPGSYVIRFSVNGQEYSRLFDIRPDETTTLTLSSP
ncbi:MAG: sigma-70 family RNA polymerase sigma factor [Planctomycetes bacterium]|nr:sigma-70 family RNA polymerase sigma factor [Planctomycetota bacterium]